MRLYADRNNGSAVPGVGAESSIEMIFLIPRLNDHTITPGMRSMTDFGRISGENNPGGAHMKRNPA